MWLLLELDDIKKNKYPNVSDLHQYGLCNDIVEFTVGASETIYSMRFLINNRNVLSW